jgi:23S rRNA pseudouridine2605 synthase
MTGAPDEGWRLNRFLARAGHGSRRAVEHLVRAGRVRCNGQVVHDLGRRIDPDADAVTVDGEPARLPEDHRVYAFHKPRGVVSTLRSQGGQASLGPFRLQADLPDRFVPVGRLDSDTTGLLLWTDDGELNQRLCRPKSGVWKVYQVELDAPLTLHLVPQLTDGRIVLDGRPCRPCRLKGDPDGDLRLWTMELQEGRKRQVRRMFHAVGRKVIHLHRAAIGPVSLGHLRPGDFRRLNPREVDALRQAVQEPRVQGKKPGAGKPRQGGR